MTMPLKFRLARRTESLWFWLAWKLPRPLVYWAAVRLIANATQGKWEHQVVPELHAMDALQRWEMP